MRYSQQSITPEDEQAVLDVLRSPWLTQGPVVERFEAALAEYVGARHAVAVNSGTAALHLAYLVANPQLVVTSPLSFVATANAYMLTWGKWEEGALDELIWFVDVDPSTGNADLGQVEEPRGYSTVFVPVHFAGRAAPIPNRFVIEDACHALGAMDFDGCSRIGSCAHSKAACFSFHPVKPITTGEGGAITTNDQGFADELRLLRSHGRDASGLMTKLGLNYRMPEMAAALGLSQLKRCDEMREKRGDLAGIYHERLWRALRGIDIADTFEYDDPCNAYHLLPARIKNGRRDAVKAKLGAQGIGAQIHYSPIVPAHPYYAALGYKAREYPNAQAWSAEELSLPLHAGMTEADVERVCVALREALA